MKTSNIEDDLQSQINNMLLLVVGAGGIGCELLKNLVICGFKNIEVLDLDTIDVSNLNRQFFFRKEHVNLSKAEVAKQAILKFAPNTSIVSYHANIKDKTFSADFYERFDVVLNALDNLEARSHVNRLCLATNTILIEAGSSGFAGQATVIIPNVSECFDCQPKPKQKEYPVCTIRSTPDKPVHCIVWARFLFSLLVGVDDDSNILSDLKDKIAGANHEEVAKNLFQECFVANVEEQASLGTWTDAQPAPRSISYDSATADLKGDPSKQRQTVWSLAECASIFVSSLCLLLKDKEKGPIEFDKNNDLCMDFVTAASNVRCWNYRIPMQSRWNVESIAGAIVPAIATTNAIVAGLQVCQLLHIVRAKLAFKEKNDEFHNYIMQHCKTVWVQTMPTSDRVFNVEPLAKPNSGCWVCSSKTLTAKIKSLESWTIKRFVGEVLQKKFAINEAFVMFGDSIIWDDGDEDHDETYHADWNLSQFNITNNSLLQISDYSQGNLEFSLRVVEDDAMDEWGVSVSSTELEFGESKTLVGSLAGEKSGSELRYEQKKRLLDQQNEGVAKRPKLGEVVELG